jgi:hypothetical protein
VESKVREEGLGQGSEGHGEDDYLRVARQALLDLA